MYNKLSSEKVTSYLFPSDIISILRRICCTSIVLLLLLIEFNIIWASVTLDTCPRSVPRANLNSTR